jgi:hypothetical protein
LVVVAQHQQMELLHLLVEHQTLLEALAELAMAQVLKLEDQAVAVEIQETVQQVQQDKELQVVLHHQATKVQAEVDMQQVEVRQALSLDHQVEANPQAVVAVADQHF